MQLMPQTATRMGVQNPMDAADNVEGGTRYLRELLVLYNQNLTKALAAYNAGPGRIQQYQGVPPYPETITYINRVIRELYQRKIASLNLQYKKSARTKSELVSKTSRTASPARPREMAERRPADPATAPLTLTP
jgi:soluble lytic murein transglycosylase-like protein